MEPLIDKGWQRIIIIGDTVFVEWYCSLIPEAPMMATRIDPN